MISSACFNTSSYLVNSEDIRLCNFLSNSLKIHLFEFFSFSNHFQNWLSSATGHSHTKTGQTSSSNYPFYSVVGDNYGYNFKITPLWTTYVAATPWVTFNYVPVNVL